MSTVIREHGIRYLGPAAIEARERGTGMHYPADLVDVFGEELRHESPRVWVQRHAADLPAWRAEEARVANERWASLAPEAGGANGCIPFERVGRDIGYAAWREPTTADVEMAHRGQDYRRRNWGVRAEGEVTPHASHDAATRALHNNRYGWTLAVRDVTPSRWVRLDDAGRELA